MDSGGRFWPITSELFGFDANASYYARLAVLRSHGVALWEVVHRCRRIGSADSAIEPKSLVANNFAELFGNYPTIARVYFNGTKAADLYRRLAHPLERIHYQRLPSTSPANAMRPGAKLAAWQAISLS
jgi:hypoxanthine-DNA glycosylase